MRENFFKKNFYKKQTLKTAGLPKEPVDETKELKDKTADHSLLALGEGLLDETGGSECYSMLNQNEDIKTTKKSISHDVKTKKLGKELAEAMEEDEDDEEEDETSEKKK